MSRWDGVLRGLALAESQERDPSELVSCQRCGCAVPYVSTEFYPHTTVAGQPIADLRSCIDSDRCNERFATHHPELARMGV